MDIKSVYCNNCGIKGHLYKECKKPVISCGNIIFRIDDEESKILMINRKDSLCYIDFLRGKYNLHDIDYLLHLCNHFSISEKENIIRYSFDELWRKLWVLEDKNIKSHIKHEYKKGKEKFEKLKKGTIIGNDDGKIIYAPFDETVLIMPTKRLFLLHRRLTKC